MAVTLWKVTRAAPAGATTNNGADTVFVWSEAEEDAIAAASASRVGDAAYDTAVGVADADAGSEGDIEGSYKAV